ncbi:MAG: hypothetical protein R3D62_03165 [Xanthobacteraceae bacterium]
MAVFAALAPDRMALFTPPRRYATLSRANDNAVVERGQRGGRIGRDREVGAVAADRHAPEMGISTDMSNANRLGRAVLRLDPGDIVSRTMTRSALLRALFGS